MIQKAEPTQVPRCVGSLATADGQCGGPRLAWEEARTAMGEQQVAIVLAAIYQRQEQTCYLQ